MRVFGCVTYAKVPNSLRNKLDDKGIKCRFVGYTENGYRLGQEGQGIIHCRNVIFDENNFDVLKETVESTEHIISRDTESDDENETENYNDNEVTDISENVGSNENKQSRSKEKKECH